MIYGKKLDQQEVSNWLTSASSITIRFRKNLHAKCPAVFRILVPRNGCETTLMKPLCFACYKKYKDVFEFAAD